MWEFFVPPRTKIVVMLLNDKNLCSHCPVPPAQSILMPGKHVQSDCIIEKSKRAKAIFFPLIELLPSILHPLVSLPRERIIHEVDSLYHSNIVSSKYK